MPRGLQDPSLRDPLTFTREEWQQARRAGLDPRELKAVFQHCWRASDNNASFERALKERGFWLARGDRRGFVAIDYRGEVYSLSRYAGAKPKELQAKLGDPARLGSVEEVKAEIARGMTRKLEAYIMDVERDAKRRLATLAFRKTEVVARHQDERRKLCAAHERRWQAETTARAQRLPKGFSGIWHRLTGQYAKVKARNEHEALEAWRRDRSEKDELIFRQLEQRQKLQRDVRAQRSMAQEDMLRLREDIEHYRNLEARDHDRLHERQREQDDETDTRKQTRERRQRHRRSFDP
jgi:hypothetical protein